MYARVPKNMLSTATGFHISNDSHGATPRPRDETETATAGWK